MSYVPDIIYNNLPSVEGLGSDEFTSLVKSFRMTAYDELWRIAQEYAEYDYNAKIVVNWVKTALQVNSKFIGNIISTEVFAAGSYIQKAGFKIPVEIDLRDSSKDGYAWVRQSYSISKFNNVVMVPLTFYYSTMCERKKGGLDVAGIECKKAGYWTTSDVALHEIGHIIHANLRELGEHKKVYSQKIRKAAAEVSGYAAQENCSKSYPWKYMEFFTETLAGLLTGKKYSKDVLLNMPQLKDYDKYRSYGDYDEYVDPYKELIEKAKMGETKLGSYVPDYIYNRLPMAGVDGVNNKFCTYYNLEYYNFSDEQKKTTTYQYYDFVKECKSKFYDDPMAQLVCELFCKVMNRSFNFIDYATVNEVELETLKM